MPGSVPGLPGRGDLDLPGLPGTRSPKTVDNLFGLLKPKRSGSWDPDDWCPTLPWWRDLPNQVGWDVVARIRCLMDVGRRMRARAAIAPPVRPVRVTWT